MAQKFIINSAGHLAEREATVVSAGATDAGEIPALDAAGRLDNSVMPVGIGADTAVMESYEDLAAGDFVNVFTDAGEAKARKADASTYGKEANGFVLSASLATQDATVYFEGRNTQRTGLTAGALYWLSITPGSVTTTPPSASGNVVQQVGRAVSATALAFEQSQPIELA